MKRLLAIAIALIAAGTGGYFFGAGKKPNAAPLSREVDPTQKNIVETPLVETGASTSSRFQARLALVRRTERAGVQELWELLLSGGSERKRILDQLVALDPVAAVALATKVGDGRTLSDLMKAGSNLDPISAFRHLDQLPEFDRKAFFSGDVNTAALRESLRLGDDALVFEILGQTTHFRSRENPVGNRGQEIGVRTE